MLVLKERTSSEQPIIESPNISAIPALTGLRIIGAAWVALYHFQPTMYTAWPVMKIFEPLISTGYLGVSLFFMLSGYIIWHNYGYKAFLNLRDIVKFIWRRFARLWPVNLLSQALAFPLIYISIEVYNYWGSPIPDWYTIGGWIKAAFMVHVLSYSNIEYPWNAPSWSLTGEMVAYVLFPLVLSCIIFLRLGRFKFKKVYILVALVLVYYAQNIVPSSGLPFTWLFWVVFTFISGVLLHLAGRPSQKFSLLMSIFQLVCPIGIIATGYLNRTDFIGPMMLLWVYSLTSEKGLIVTVFNTKAMQMAGAVSYSVYMVHWLVFGYLGYIPIILPLVREKYMQAVAIFMLVVLCVSSYLIWRFIETPARKRLNLAFDQIWPKKENPNNNIFQKSDGAHERL